MSTRTKFLYADIIISCVLPGFIFAIVVVDDEMETMSRSSLYVQKRNENDSDILLSFSLSSWNLNLPIIWYLNSNPPFFLWDFIVDWRLSGIMTSKIVIRESKSTNNEIFGHCIHVYKIHVCIHVCTTFY